MKRGVGFCQLRQKPTPRVRETNLNQRLPTEFRYFRWFQWFRWFRWFRGVRWFLAMLRQPQPLPPPLRPRPQEL